MATQIHGVVSARCATRRCDWQLVSQYLLARELSRVVLRGVWVAVWLAVANQDAFCQVPDTSAPTTTPPAATTPASPTAVTSANNASFDYARLGHPDVAEFLELTDAQRATVVELLSQRAALQVTKDEQQPTKLEENQNALRQVLTDAQRSLLPELPGNFNLRFNFREQPWPDVLDWFARQAGLSLVMDTPPPKTFTFSSNRGYSTNEALDFLNGLLQTQNFTLIRRGKMLICIDLARGIPDGLIARVTPAELDQYGQHELVTVMFPLGKRPADGVDAEIKPLLGTHGTSVALPQTAQLLVTTTGERMRQISSVIASIAEPAPPSNNAGNNRNEEKKPPPPAPVFTAYSVEGIDVSAAAEMVRQLIKDIKVTADEQSNQISVYADPGQQAAVKAALDQMLANRAPANRPYVETYKLLDEKIGEPEQLLTQLRLASPAAEITYEPNQKRILVFGREPDQGVIAETLDKLGMLEADREVPQIQVYQLRRAEPAAIVTMLQTLAPRAQITSDGVGRRVVVRALPAEQSAIDQFIQQVDPRDATTSQLQFHVSQQEIGDEWLSLLRQVAPQAKLDRSSDRRQLTALGSAEDQRVIGETLLQLEHAMRTPETRELRTYDISESQRQRLNALLQDAPRDLRELKMLPGERADQIVAWAPATTHEALAALLLALKNDEQPTVEKSIRVYPVTSRQRERLNAIMNDQPREVREMKFLQAANGNELVAWGTAAAQDQLATLLLSLDPNQEAQEPRLLIYQVTKPQRDRLTSVMQVPPPALQDVRLVDTSTPGELLAWGTPRGHAALGELLRSLASEVSEGNQVETVAYPIAKADPETVREVLRELYPSTTIIAEENTKQIVVRTTKDEQQKIKQTVEQLDRPARAGEERKLMVYPIGEFEPRDVIALIRDKFPDMTFEGHTRADAIIAWGSVEDHARLAPMMAQFPDLDPERQSLEVYAAGNRDPQDLEDFLDRIAPRARVQADPVGRQVFVWAPPDQHQAIREAMAKIQSADAQLEAIGDDGTGQSGTAGGRREFRLVVYSMQRTGSRSAREAIREIVPTARIADSRDSRQLLVWANLEDHAKIKSAVDQMESDADQLSRLHLHRFDASPSVIRRVRELISSSMPEVKLIADDDPSKLTIWGSESAQKAIAEILTTMTEVADDDVRTIVRYDLPRAFRQDAMRMLQPLGDSNLSYLQAATEDQLVVWADPRQQAKVREIIDQLQAAGLRPDQRLTRVYALQNLDVNAIADSLDATLIQRMTVVRDAIREALIVSGRASDHEQLKQAIDELTAHLPRVQKRETRVYRLQTGDPSAAQTVLASVVPQASLATDFASRSLVASATAEDHARIKQTVEELDAATSDSRQTVVYDLQTANPRAAVTVLQQLLPRATFAIDEQTGRVLATARSAEHERIRETIEGLDRPAVARLQTKVYQLTRGSPSAARAALRELLPTATFAVDEDNRKLIATAAEADQTRIRLVVEGLDVPTTRPLETRVFALQTGNPDTARIALRRLVPDTLIAADDATRSLIATGPRHELDIIAQTVLQLDTLSDNEPELKAYPLANAKAEEVQASLAALFDRQPNVKFSTDLVRNTILARAPPREQQTIAQLTQQLDSLPGEQAATLQVYSLKDADGVSLLNSLRNLFAAKNPPLQLSVDNYSNQLMAVATVEQHETIRGVVQQLQGEDRQLAVFPLQVVDPLTIGFTISNLFGDNDNPPFVDSDPDSRMLLVRGTREQLQEIRQLLTQMGERNLDATSNASRTMRVIPFTGDVNAAINQLRQTLPVGNRIELVIPSELPGSSSMFFPGGPAAPVRAAPSNSWRDNTATHDGTACGGVGQDNDNQNENENENDDDNDEVASGRADGAEVRGDLSNNDSCGGDSDQDNDASLEAATPNDPSQSIHAPSPDSSAGGGASQATSASGNPRGSDVLVVPGDGRLTVFSADPQLLNQVEDFFRAVAPREMSYSSNSNFAVFGLRNAGARQVEQLLKKVLEKMPETARGTLRDLRMAADERLNALVVHGRAADRAVVAELLRVLDSSNVPESLATRRPQIVRVENTEADRVVEIVRSVYKAQINEQGQQREIEIPEGLSDEVATVLRQLNAAQAGPLLTVEVDQQTNSIVLLAPQELGQEVIALVRRLDENAVTQNSRSVQMIQLKSLKSDTVQDLLQDLLRSRGR